MTEPAGSLTLLVTSPRVAAGLLTRDAWEVLSRADRVLAADTDDPTPAALAASGVHVEPLDAEPASLARELAQSAVDSRTVWVGSPDADPGLTDALAAELTRLPDPPEVEVLVASWDVPGARLLDAVAVMDQLRSPGGCPWDAEQTHESLTKYLLEEAHETVEAIETGDREHLAEELGDVLLQVLFHARIAAEHPEAPFDVDDVAAGLVGKLVRRHPHVFADGDASSPEDVERAWERIKADEKPTRDADDLLAGIPASLPLPLAIDKVRSRLRRRAPDPALDVRLEQLAETARRDAERAREQLRALLDERA